jgi:hypothetical protein
MGKAEITAVFEKIYYAGWGVTRVRGELGGRILLPPNSALKGQATQTEGSQGSFSEAVAPFKRAAPVERCDVGGFA